MESLTRWTGVGWTPGVSDGQGGLVCCSSWGCKELDTTERLNKTELIYHVPWAAGYCCYYYITALKSYIIIIICYVQFSSVAQPCPTLCNPMNCSTPGFLPSLISQSLLKLMSIESVMPSNHLILYDPLLLLPSIFPSIRVFFSESVLRIMWPKCWNFSFISPSNEHSGLISFRMDWFDTCCQIGRASCRERV